MKIRTAEYYVQEVLRSLRRNNWMTFAAVGTVAVSLFILGVFLILALNMNRAASMLESQVQISVYLKDDLSEDAEQNVGAKIKALQGIESVKYVGATDEFIRWPFVLEGIVLGFIGGVISALVLRSFYAGVVNKVYDTLAFFPLIPQSPFMTYVGIVIVLLGMAIGAAGAWVSLKRFLKV